MQFSEHERRVLLEVEEDLIAETPRLAEMLRTGDVKRSRFDLVVLVCALLPGVGVFVIAVVVESVGLLLVALILFGLSFPGAKALTRIMEDS